MAIRVKEPEAFLKAHPKVVLEGKWYGNTVPLYVVYTKGIIHQVFGTSHGLYEMEDVPGKLYSGTIYTVSKETIDSLGWE